jgi:hypothetical protein
MAARASRFKEEAMAALISREQARRTAVKAFMSELDRIIPADEAVPLKGAKCPARK